MTPKEHEFDPVNGRCGGCGLTRGEVATTGKTCTVLTLENMVADAQRQMIGRRGKSPDVPTPDMGTPLVGVDSDGKVKPAAELEYPSPANPYPLGYDDKVRNAPPRPCECVNWAGDFNFDGLHHPHCPKNPANVGKSIGIEFDAAGSPVHVRTPDGKAVFAGTLSWECNPKASPIEDVRAAQAMLNEHTRPIGVGPGVTPERRRAMLAGRPLPESGRCECTAWATYKPEYGDHHPKCISNYIGNAGIYSAPSLPDYGSSPIRDLVAAQMAAEFMGVTLTMKDLKAVVGLHGDLPAAHHPPDPERLAVIEYTNGLVDALIVRLHLSPPHAAIARDMARRHVEEYLS